MYHLLNVKSEVDNQSEASEGPLVHIQGQRAGTGPASFTIVFPKNRQMVEAPKKNVNGIDPLSFPNNSTQTLLISR